jgi:hypothetical protein
MSVADGVGNHQQRYIGKCTLVLAKGLGFWLELKWQPNGDGTLAGAHTC